jgi:membrane-associated phospholipid phosphatase
MPLRPIRSSSLSRIEARAEDVLTVAATLGLLAVLGTKALTTIRLSESNYWDFAFILLPVALLVLGASIRYAFRPIGAPGVAEMSAETGSILRDWSPFLIFLMLYESFRLNTWSAVSVVDKDPMLLSWDRALFGNTPSVIFDSWVRGWLTSLMTIAYFLHLVLPPFIGVVWYRRDLRIFRQFLLSVLVTGIIGSQGYILVPAIGPGTAFPSLYHHALSGAMYGNVTYLLDTARAFRDVFPSLHVAISSIVLWFAWRRSRVLGAVMLPLVVANWISTMYLRYHYLVDVIAGWATAALAIALAMFILRIEDAIRKRARAAA